MTMAVAPPPPLQIAATPYLPRIKEEKRREEKRRGEGRGGERREGRGGERRRGEEGEEWNRIFGIVMSQDVD